MVLEALSQDHRTGLPWELLYADDLVVAAKTITHLEDKYLAWKRRMEEKDLRLNIDKTKVMVCKVNNNMTIAQGKHPCVVSVRKV